MAYGDGPAHEFELFELDTLPSVRECFEGLILKTHAPMRIAGSRDEVTAPTSGARVLAEIAAVVKDALNGRQSAKGALVLVDRLCRAHTSESEGKLLHNRSSQADFRGRERGRWACVVDLRSSPTVLRAAATIGPQTAIELCEPARSASFDALEGLARHMSAVPPDAASSEDPAFLENGDYVKMFVASAKFTVLPRAIAKSTHVRVWLGARRADEVTEAIAAAAAEAESDRVVPIDRVGALTRVRVGESASADVALLPPGGADALTRDDAEGCDPRLGAGDGSLSTPQPSDVIVIVADTSNNGLETDIESESANVRWHRRPRPSSSLFWVQPSSQLDRSGGASSAQSTPVDRMSVSSQPRVEVELELSRPSRVSTRGQGVVACAVPITATVKTLASEVLTKWLQHVGLSGVKHDDRWLHDIQVLLDSALAKDDPSLAVRATGGIVANGTFTWSAFLELVGRRNPDYPHQQFVEDTELRTIKTYVAATGGLLQVLFGDVPVHNGFRGAFEQMQMGDRVVYLSAVVNRLRSTNRVIVSRVPADLPAALSHLTRALFAP